MPPPVPEWITFDTPKTQGLDLLGLRAPVQAIGNELLNGLTSVTPKLRYLSVLCWVIWRYAEARLLDDWTAFREFAAAQEAVIVMANVLHDSTTLNLVGVGKAGDLLESSARTLPLGPLVQNIAFNIYASASRQLGLTFEADSGVYGLSEQRGLKLARAFASIVDSTSYGRRLAKVRRIDHVSRTEVEELSKSLSLDILPQPEKTILIDAILPAVPVDSAERRRLATFAVLLWLSAQKGGEIEESDVYKAACEPPQKIPAVLGDTLDGWLDYTIRDVLAVTHEAVFQAVAAEVDAASARRGGHALATEVTAALLNAVDEHDEVVRQLGLMAKNESVRHMGFHQIEERIQRACQNHEAFSNGLRRWRGGLSEGDLYEAALHSGPASAALLPIAWCLVAHRVTPLVESPTIAPRRVLSLGGVFQIGLQGVVLPKLDEYRRLKPPYMHVMADLSSYP